jgi:hypothetical protein
VIADLEIGVPSRFSAREDLIRIALDLVEEINGQKPRLWLVCSPNLQGRLQTLVEAAMNRKLTDEEADGFELEEVLGKEVNVVVAQAQSRGGLSYPRIVTFFAVVEQR